MLKTTGILLFIFLIFAQIAFSQKADSLKNSSYFSGTFGVTNNGISIVPSFSLGKPAAIFIMSLGKKRFSFEPDLRFSLKGKPWSFLFWGRYQVFTKEKFKMNAGAHLGLNFRTSILNINGDSSETTVARRYLAGELFPRVLITKNIVVGIYYLYAHGIDAGAIKNTNFLTLNLSFSNIKLSKQIFMRIYPQLYYLKLDAEDGIYFTSTISIAKKNFPLFLSSIYNQTIKSNITGNKNMVWNVSLNYTFFKKFVKMQ